MELASDPATPVRPNKIDPNEPLPDGFSALTTSYSAVVALRNKVNRVSDSHDIAAQRKLEPPARPGTQSNTSGPYAKPSKTPFPGFR